MESKPISTSVFVNPLSRNLRKPWLCLIWANTGYT